MARTIKSVMKGLFFRPLQWFYLRYNNRQRSVRMKGFQFEVGPGVFDPRLFFSTSYLMSYLQELSLEGLSVLDVGCGTGALALQAAKQGGNVSAVDINPVAVQSALQSAEKNNLKVLAFSSDLWEKLEGQRFDLVLVNPPYYPKKPNNMEEHAWYCGEGFEYFERFFSGLPSHLNVKGQVIMVLSEDCDISSIKGIAQSNGFVMDKVNQKKIYWELNFIFEIRLHSTY